MGRSELFKKRKYAQMEKSAFVPDQSVNFPSRIMHLE